MEPHLYEGSFLYAIKADFSCHSTFTDMLEKRMPYKMYYAYNKCHEQEKNSSKKEYQASKAQGTDQCFRRCFVHAFGSAWRVSFVYDHELRGGRKGRHRNSGSVCAGIGSAGAAACYADSGTYCRAHTDSDACSNACADPGTDAAERTYPVRG